MSRYLPAPSIPVPAAVLTDDVRQALAAERAPFLAVAGQRASGTWRLTVLDTATADVRCSVDVPAAGHQWWPAAVENTLWRRHFIALPGTPRTVLALGRHCVPAYATGPQMND